jgi:hypothetical protein
MGFFKKLFGGAGSKAASGSRGFGDDRGMYFYVQPKGCDEVIRVRVDPMNDMSESDDGSSFFVRKGAVGMKCFNKAEIELTFNASKQLVDSHVTGGALVDEAAWQAWTRAST